MVINITEAALEKLQKMEWKKEHAPRIDADVAGGCGLSVKFSLIFDEPRRNDIVVEYGEITLHIDHFTKRYLDNETQISYSEEHHFSVGDSFASSACAIEFE
ncbi:iron-sulfur cluster biosynthesis family protein [Metabacillus niabensis]|uniref:iron-sulfur cluster biosynthesis family protein n=1 Tax=Metabacillus niabensis TaxID=324854 RepID=UPI001CF9A335|nr:iron-sulfur cluster biosynthesis family protein [Metabacillus niabensis]